MCLFDAPKSVMISPCGSKSAPRIHAAFAAYGGGGEAIHVKVLEKLLYGSRDLVVIGI